MTYGGEKVKNIAIIYIFFVFIENIEISINVICHLPIRAQSNQCQMRKANKPKTELV